MRQLVESLKNGSRMVNESKHLEFVAWEGSLDNDINVGAYGDEIGFIIGEPWKGGNAAGQRKAEAIVKKLGLKIDFSYDEAQELEQQNDGDLTGLMVCYYVNQDNFQDKTGVECQVFEGDADPTVYALK